MCTKISIGEMFNIQIYNAYEYMNEIVRKKDSPSSCTQHNFALDSLLYVNVNDKLGKE
jgi:hypothetical protein